MEVVKSLFSAENLIAPLLMPNAEIKCHRCLKIHESKEGAGLSIFLIGMKVGILVFIFVYVFCIQEKLNKMSQ